MKKCVRTAIERAAIAAAIVPGPIFVLDIDKRCATRGLSLFGSGNQVPERGIGRE
jgi:hypothetical protein